MEEEKTCETCRHFCRHYIRWGGNKYRPMDQGHCMEPRVKDRKTQTPACQRYSKKRGKEEG